MAFNNEKTRNWTRSTPNDGDLFDDEFDRIYDNFNEFINPAGDELEINTLKSSSLEVSGNIQCDGTVDGIDLSDFKSDYDTRIEYSQQGLLDNAIINGDMRIAQRGTSFSNVGNSQYTLDRFVHWSAGSGVWTVLQDSDVPEATPFPYSMKAQVTTANTTINSEDANTIGQRVEGFNAYPLSCYDYMTISFYSKCNKTGTFCVSLRNEGIDRSYVVEETIDNINTWKEHVIIIPTNWSGGTWNWTTGKGFRVHISLLAGSTYQTTPNAWQNGNFIATSNQTNFFDSVGNQFWITGVKLNKGNIAIPFNPRLYSLEIDLCQRYYEPVGTWGWWGDTTSGCSYCTFVPFKVRKRTISYSVAFAEINYYRFPSGYPTVAWKSHNICRLGKSANSTGGQGYYAYNVYIADEL